MRTLLSGVGIILAIAMCPVVAPAASFQTLYSFSGGSDGLGPYGKLVIGAGGLLYGTTVSGGTAQRGNIYSLDPATGTETTLYSFTGGADGSNPQTGLASDAKGVLYGVTPTGGSTAHCNSGCGVIYKFDPAKSKFTVLYTFTGLDDGGQPVAAITVYNGALYGSNVLFGTGANCGVYGCGTLFRYTIAGKTLTTLRQLTTQDGVNDGGRMVPGPAGLLYGTAAAGGPHGAGVVFSLDPQIGAYGVVHGFDYHVDGAYSQADLIVRNGILYGTTAAGGPTDAADGTIFSLDPASGTLTTLYSFTGQSDGSGPDAGVTLGPSNMLYGGTVQGGKSGAGTLFRDNAKSLAFKTIHDFSISDGQGPSGPLLAVQGGALYGVTSGGGRGAGTVFKLIP